MVTQIRRDYVGLLLVTVLTASAVSYASYASEPPESPSASHSSASELRVAPRLGVGYNSSGAGFDGATRFEGFIPILQHPGDTLTFLEGRLLLDNSANLGGNLLLGHRSYSQTLDRLFGGYVAYDIRNTGNIVFHQLGLGIESLGEIWDFRANAYLPIGDTRQLADDRIFNTLHLSDTPVFEGYHLTLQGEIRQHITRFLEAAMTGFDLEVGARLLQIGDRHDLRGYGGLYWYDAAGSPEIVGWRLRLEGHFTDTWNLGLSVQEDELFGTNLVVTVGASFPSSQTPRRDDEDSALQRIGESIDRTASITVDSQVEFEDIIEPFSIALTNPETGNPYVFQHVSPEAIGGDGTFESPFRRVRDALAAANSGQIVYVQSASNTRIPGGANFVIPDGVSVLSTGPIQEIEIAELGIVPLPLSGNGQLPDVLGSIRMGNNTRLSGFAITRADGIGIGAENISNVVIEDNVIQGVNGRGISLENVNGTVVIADNTISGLTTLGQGIFVSSNAGELDLLISRNWLGNNDILQSIEIQASNNASQRFAIRDNVIDDSSIDGIAILAFDEASQEFTLDQNRISNDGLGGIAVSAFNNANQEFVFSQNAVSNDGLGGVVVSAFDQTEQDFIIERNVVQSDGLGGIFVSAFDEARQTFVIRQNAIESNRLNSIVVSSFDDATQDFELDENAIITDEFDPAFITSLSEITQEFILDDLMIDNRLSKEYSDFK
ncbi:MAG: right-handed parallel beta-helix repeat-containing protein [Elainellaceae cyanobacterium]